MWKQRLLFLGVLCSVFLVSAISSASQFVLLVEKSGFITVPSAANPAQYRAPGGSVFVKLDTQTSPNAGGAQVEYYVVRFSKVGKQESTIPAAAALPEVAANTNYLIPKGQLPAYDYRPRSGITVGALAIPFKYQLSAGEFTAGGTLGLFGGYRWYLSQDISLTATLVAGPAALSSAKLTSTSSGAGAATQNTLFGFTTAAGAIFTYDRIQAGLVLGTDLASKSSEYEYDKKFWAALTIGFQFIDTI